MFFFLNRISHNLKLAKISNRSQNFPMVLIFVCLFWFLASLYSLFLLLAPSNIGDCITCYSTKTLNASRVTPEFGSCSGNHGTPSTTTRYGLIWTINSRHRPGAEALVGHQEAINIFWPRHKAILAVVRRSSGFASQQHRQPFLLQQYHHSELSSGKSNQLSISKPIFGH